MVSLGPGNIDENGTGLSVDTIMELIKAFEESVLKQDIKHYVFVSIGDFPLTMCPSKILGYVTENATSTGHTLSNSEKYRVLPTQVEWLATHTNCDTIAWLSMDCPVYPILACKDCSKMIKPTIKRDDIATVIEEDIIVEREI